MSKRNRPSPALALAFVALLVALGGSAAAGVPARIAKAISGKSIKSHSIAGSKLKNNTLTGRQIAESKLRIVPKAKKSITARTAGVALTAGNVGGVTARKLVAVQKPGTGNQLILSLNGVNLFAACSGLGNPGLRAQSTIGGGDVRVSVINTASSTKKNGTTRLGADSTFDNPNTIDATRGVGSGNGALEFVNRANGQIVSAHYTFHHGSKTAPCVFAGVAFGG